MEMKLIHCADLHLDAKMESSLPKEKAKERRLEILRTFTRMVESGSQQGVDAILLCGDVFDAKTISARARKSVLDAIVNHPEITFYYLQGNHDQNSFLSEIDEMPKNLKTFESQWTTYEQSGIFITGVDISDIDSITNELFDQLILDADHFNVVLLHGILSEYGAKNQKEGFSLRALRGKNIDYLALGHIHSFHMEKLDERGRWCYSGCLEGRGFDECGEKGYVLLEIEEKKLSAQFVPFAQRTLHEIAVDVSTFTMQEEILRAIQKAIEAVPKEDIVKIVLTGEVSPELEKNLDWLEKWLEDACYFLKIKDETKLLVRPEDYQYDISLKGEFVRLVLASRLTKEEKQQVLRMGIRALAGED